MPHRTEAAREIYEALDAMQCALNHMSAALRVLRESIEPVEAVLPDREAPAPRGGALAAGDPPPIRLAAGAVPPGSPAADSPTPRFQALANPQGH